MATQEERKAETRALLLDAAARLFASRGVHAVSVDAIAEAAGRTSGALYAHFGGKDGLLVELVDHQSRRAAARITSQVDGDADIDDLLRSVWRGWAEPAGDGSDGTDAGDGEGTAWSQLEHELWLEATRRPEVADRLAERFAAARRTSGTGLRTWHAQALLDGAAASNGGASNEAGSEVGEPGDRADEVGTLVLALLFGLEMQRRVDPASVSDDLAVLGLKAILGAGTELLPS